MTTPWPESSITAMPLPPTTSMSRAPSARSRSGRQTRSTSRSTVFDASIVRAPRSASRNKLTMRPLWLESADCRLPRSPNTRLVTSVATTKHKNQATTKLGCRNASATTDPTASSRPVETVTKDCGRRAAPPTSPTER